MYQISFSITPSQLWEQSVLAMHRAQGWSAYLQPIGYGVLLAILSLIPRYCSSCDFDDSSFNAGNYAMFLGMLAFDYVFIRYIRKLYAAPNGMALEERRLRADENSIEVEGSHYKSVYSWSAIQNVSVGKSIMVLWTDNGAGKIIPKSAFKSAAEFENFRQFVEAKVATQAN